ncbi:MAG: ATP-binding cassette domain-containing protein, partial [Pleurocapsa sp.]
MEHSVILQLKNITKTYDSRTDRGNVLVLNDVSLTLKHGELLGLLGPSGCGKTTLLRIMDGIESISQGTEGIAGRVVSTNSEA